MSLIVRKDPYAKRHQHVSLPSPSLNTTLARNLFSWAERLSIFYYPVLAPDQYISFSALKLSICQDPALARIIQRLNKLAVEILSDEEPRVHLLLRDAREVLEPQIAFNIELEATIKSHRACQEKARQIKQLTKQAFILYFNNGGRETRQKIDEALLFAAQKKTAPNLTRLQLYWDAAAANEWGAEWHETLEKTIYQVLTQALQEGVSRAESLQEVLFKNRYGHFAKRSLELAVKGAAEGWAVEPQNKSIFCGDHIKLNYMLLKGSLWKMPLIRSCLKQILLPLIAKTGSAIETMAREKEKAIQNEIARLSEDLSSAACCVDREAIKDQLGCPAPYDIVEYRLKVNQDHRELCLIALERLHAYTFEGHLEWAKRQWNYNPQEMESVLNEESPYDKKVIEVLKLTRIVEDPDLHDQEMGLDLKSLHDPVAYFVEQFKKRDAEALALLPSIVIEIHDLTTVVSSP